MIIPTFRQMLMHHYKDLRELRKENGINQFFHAVISYNCNVHDKDLDEVIAYAINEAYRLVIVFLEDPTPLNDPYYSYYHETDMRLSGDVREMVLDIFVTMLRMQIESPTDAMLVGTNFDKAEEFVRILNDERGNRIGIIESEGPTERQRNTGKWSIVTTPTPPEKFANIDCDSWQSVTDDFDQETICKIVYRYDTKDDQLAILKLIREAFAELHPSPIPQPSPVNDFPF